MQANIGPYLVDIVIVYKKNKNIYIRIKDDLKMYVTCSRFVSKQEILKVINNNQKSLLKMYEKKLKSLEKNKYHYYLGEKYTVLYDNNVKKPSIDNNYIIVKNDSMLNKFYKEECLSIFNKRLNDLLNLFDHIPKFKLRVRKMTTRWGVNNITSKTITLNSELIKYDISLIDYVIVHELCHFYHHDHSKLFWNEVAKRYPYYKEARKRLRED